MKDNEQPIRILVIEDNPQEAKLIRRMLGEYTQPPFEVEWAGRLEVGLESLTKGHVDLALVDLHLPDSQGLETLTKVQHQAPGLPVVILTMLDDEKTAIEAVRQGAQDYLVKKKYDGQLLSRVIRYALERKRVHEQIRQDHARNEELLASLPSILIGVGPTDLVTHWNRVSERVLGVAASQVVNKALAECGVSWDRQKIAQGLVGCRQANYPTRLDDVQFTRPNGEQGLLGFTVIPLQGAGSDRAGLLLFGAEITQRRQAEEAVKEEKTRLERMNRIMMNREERILELKQEINHLCKELGQAPTYRG